MSTKKIIVNPEHLKISGKKESKTRSKTLKRRERHSQNREKARNHSLKPKLLQKKLLQKIKLFQKEREDIKISNHKPQNQLSQIEPEDTLDEAMQTLQEIIRKAKREKQKTQKQKQQNQYIQKQWNKNEEKNHFHKMAYGNQQKNQQFSSFSQQPNFKSQQPSLIKPDPPYGCLKNGNKQTFRQYHRTIKHRKEASQKPLIIHSNTVQQPIVKQQISTGIKNSIDFRKEKLREIQQSLNVIPKVERNSKKYKKFIVKTLKKKI